MEETHDGFDKVQFRLSCKMDRTAEVPSLGDGVGDCVFLDDFPLERSPCGPRGVAHFDAGVSDQAFDFFV